MNGLIRRQDNSNLGILTLACMTLLFITTTAVASDLSVLGRWSNGPCQTLVQFEDLVVAGNGASVELLHLDVDGTAVALGKIVMPDIVEHVALADTLVLASCGASGLQIISVADPAAPRLIGSWNEGLDVHASVVGSRYAYLAEENQALRVLDLRNPDTPESVYEATATYNATALSLVDNIVYVGNDDGDLHLYDITDARHPEHTDWYGNSSDVYDIAVQDGLAYLAQGSLGLLVIDISNPYDIDDVGLFPIAAGWALGVDVSGNRAYVAAAGGGMRIIDISDLADMHETMAYETGGYGRDVIVSGQPPTAVLILMADSWLGVRLIVPYTPGLPSLLATALARADARRLAVDNSLIAILDHDTGVRLLDAVSPETPLELSSINLGHARDVQLNDGLMAVAREREGWSLIDVSTPEQPEVLTTLESPGLARAVALANGHAWLADGDSGLRIYDISAPRSPAQVGFIWAGSNLLDVVVTDDHAVLVDEYDGLLVVDVTDPSLPSLLGEVELAGTPQAVAVRDDHAYIAAGNAGFIVVSFADPENPVEVATVSTPTPAVDISICENYLSVACGTRGVRIYNVVDPTDPFLAADHATNNGMGIACLDRRIYLVDGFDGLWVMRNELPIALEDDDSEHTNPLPGSALQLASPYPNPANPGTTIRFELEMPGDVIVSIVDIRGRSVRDLMNGPSAAGEQTLFWDGRDNAGRNLPSGAYIVRVMSSLGAKSRPFGLVR